MGSWLCETIAGVTQGSNEWPMVLLNNAYLHKWRPLYIVSPATNDWLHVLQKGCLDTTGDVGTEPTYGNHYSDIIMSLMMYPITSLMIIYSTVYSSIYKKNQSFASLNFVWGIHWWPVNSLPKGPVTRKMSPFDDVIMEWRWQSYGTHCAKANPSRVGHVNTLRLRQVGRNFADHLSKCIFLNENVEFHLTFHWNLC